MAFSSTGRRQARNNMHVADTLGERTYNILLGFLLLYGFAINALIVTFTNPAVLYDRMWLVLIGYLVCVIAGSFLSRSANPAMAFVGYNLVVAPIGFVLAACLGGYAVDDIKHAVVLTGCVVIVMILAATAFPQFFVKLAPSLGIALIGTIIVELVATLLGYRGNALNWLVVGIFSLYLGFDWYRSQSCPKTVNNAIANAVDIYLDIINIFIRLLEITGRRR